MMENEYGGAEKRKFKRIVFSARDEVTGTVTWPEHADKPFSYRISDISAGGVRFIISKRDSPPIIDHDDRLLLGEIKGTRLEFVADVALAVRWVIEHEMFEHMVIGCEFVNITDDVRMQIDQFVEFELAAKNQEE
jgi:c-di-GMP-binding flagellar brake protein YcgR